MGISCLGSIQYSVVSSQELGGRKKYSGVRSQESVEGLGDRSQESVEGLGERSPGFLLTTDSLTTQQSRVRIMGVFLKYIKKNPQLPF